MMSDHEPGEEPQEARPALPFALPAGTDVVSITHLLELGRDLGLPEMSQLIIKPRADVFVDWSSEAKASLVGLSQLGHEQLAFATGGAELLDRPGFGPELLLDFRRVYSYERPQWTAALAAFYDEVEPFTRPEVLAQVRYMREADVPHGMFDWITVAAATTFLPAAGWPSDATNQADVIGKQLDLSLRALNDFLIALSLARHDFAIGPIARGDLPDHSPVIVEAFEASPKVGKRSGFFTFLGIHANPDFPRRPPRDFHEIDEHELLAAHMSRAHFFGHEPFFLFFELMQDAIRQFNDARFSASAIWVASAVEVALATVIREAGATRGIPEAEVHRVLSIRQFRHLVTHHLEKFVPCAIDLEDPGNAFGRWWKGGYQLRNEVVHRGHRATRAEALQALDDGNALVEAVRTALAAAPVTESVAASLHWGPRDTVADSE